MLATPMGVHEEGGARPLRVPGDGREVRLLLDDAANAERQNVGRAAGPGEHSGLGRGRRAAAVAIAAGENPDALAAQTAETPAAKNLAGKIEARLKGSDNARAHYEAAIERHHAGDGKACIRELDAHDKLQTNATQRSTSPRSYIGFYRAECLMLAGQCSAGKELSRKWYETSGPGGANSGPVATDRFVEGESVRYCQGAQKTSREQLLGSWHTLIGAGSGRQLMDTAACTREKSNVTRLLSEVPAADEGDEVKSIGGQLPYSYAACLAKAGDCAGAFKAYGSDRKPTMDAFNMRHPSCKGKAGP